VDYITSLRQPTSRLCKLIFGLLLVAGPFLASSQALGIDQDTKPYTGVETPPHLGPAPSYESVLSTRRKNLLEKGFKNWNWLSSECKACEFSILPNNLMLESAPVFAFIRTLENESSNLTDLFKSKDQEYIHLAHISLGILGRESLFFGARRYWLKENFQPGVDFLKFLQRQLGFSNVRNYKNSRGPTQIKDIPELIASKYQVVPDNLFMPKNAAVATMGYLLEAFKELKRIASAPTHEHIQPENYVDYLPYIYFGSRKALINKNATPEKNIYVRDMKKYMEMVEIYYR